MAETRDHGVAATQVLNQRVVTQLEMPIGREDDCEQRMALGGGRQPSLRPHDHATFLATLE